MTTLGQADIDEYRHVRLQEKTRRGGPPSPATLDKEVEILKRTLNYAVRCRRIPDHPWRDVALLREPNVRRRVVTPAEFDLFMSFLPEVYGVLLMVLFDTGMRKREVFDLRMDQLHLDEGFIELAPQDTKTEKPRRVFLSERCTTGLRRWLSRTA